MLPLSEITCSYSVIIHYLGNVFICKFKLCNRLTAINSSFGSLVFLCITLTRNDVSHVYLPFSAILVII